MDYHLKPSKDDLKSFLYTFRDCAECGLHKNRKTPVSGRGSVDASVVILLDRVSAGAGYSGDIMSGGEGKTLQRVLKFVAEYYPVIRDNFLWVTPVTICPTRRGGKQEMLPAPSAKEQAACSPRLYGEIHRIQPEIIVACGASAYKALTPARSAAHADTIGRVIDGYVQGSVGAYPIPTMVTYSMNQLYRDPTQTKRGIWNKTIGHFKQAVSIATILAEKRR